MTGKTELIEDYVCLTKSHVHGTTYADWFVKSYERKDQFDGFIKVEPDDKVGVVKVKCTELTAERSEVEVSYKYLAPSTTGESFVSGLSNAVFEEFIGEWQALISNYFRSKA